MSNLKKLIELKNSIEVTENESNELERHLTYSYIPHGWVFSYNSFWTYDSIFIKKEVDDKVEPIEIRLKDGDIVIHSQGHYTESEVSEVLGIIKKFDEKKIN